MVSSSTCVCTTAENAIRGARLLGCVVNGSQCQQGLLEVGVKEVWRQVQGFSKQPVDPAHRLVSVSARLCSAWAGLVCATRLAGRVQ